MHCSKLSKGNKQLKIDLINSAVNEGYFGRSRAVLLK